MRAAAAPGNRAAAAVEEAEVDIAIAAEPGELVLRAEETPVGDPVAAVLVAVGVPEHDLLEAAASLELSGVRGLVEERSHRRRGASEIVDRLEERDDVDPARDAPRLDRPESHLAQQDEHLEKVAHVVGHADDV